MLVTPVAADAPDPVYYKTGPVAKAPPSNAPSRPTKNNSRPSFSNNEARPVFAEERISFSEHNRASYTEGTSISFSGESRSSFSGTNQSSRPRLSVETSWSDELDQLPELTKISLKPTATIRKTNSSTSLNKNKIIYRVPTTKKPAGFRRMGMFRGAATVDRVDVRKALANSDSDSDYGSTIR